MNLKDAIRTIPDYPKPGIMFRDVTTLLADKAAFDEAVRALAAFWPAGEVVYVAGIEARGFIFGAPVALALGAGFIPLRKPGKLPGKTISEEYALEYGMDTLHLHDGALPAGARVVLIDDLIATGGTAAASARLLKRAGAEILGCGFVVDLPDLGGADRLRESGLRVETLVAFEGY